MVARLKQLRSNNLNTLLFLSLLLLIIGRLQIMQQHNIYIYALQLLVGVTISILLYFKLRRYREYKKYQTLVFFTFLLALFNAVFVGNTGFKEVLSSFIFFSSIASILLFVKLNHYLVTLSFWVVVIIFTLSYASTQSLDDILVNSRNYITYYLILYLFPYILSCRQNHKEISFAPLLVCVIFSFLAIGRGGIIMSLVLLAGILILKMGHKSKHRKFYVTQLITIVVVVLIVGVNPDVIELLFGRFIDKSIDSEARTLGWLEYISAMSNTVNLMTGVKITSLPHCTIVLGESLHNSYLSLHSRIGISAFVYLMIMFRGFNRIVKRDKYVALVLCALLIKAFVDTDFPFYFIGGDIYMYVLLFYGVISKIYVNEKS